LIIAEKLHCMENFLSAAERAVAKISLIFTFEVLIISGGI